jgi:hypothetical protein
MYDSLFNTHNGRLQTLLWRSTDAFMGYVQPLPAA